MIWKGKIPAKYILMEMTIDQLHFILLPDMNIQ